MSHALKQVFNKDKTFRPKRKFEPGTQRFELHKKAQASLNAGLDLKVAVQLPPGEEQNDWVAVHVVDFFNRINLIYGTISDYCTEQSCPVMSGGPKYEYRWQDEHKYRKPTALSAPQYMNLLMDWIEVQINNEDIFPTNVGTPFPKNFLPVVKKILSRLFRVFVHVYIHHFDRITQMGSEAHVNTCYKHFYYFVKEFNLIDTKELEPLVSVWGGLRVCGQHRAGGVTEGSGTFSGGPTPNPGVSFGPLTPAKTLRGWSMSRDKNRAGEGSGATEGAGDGSAWRKGGSGGTLWLCTAPDRRGQLGGLSLVPVTGQEETVSSCASGSLHWGLKENFFAEGVGQALEWSAQGSVGVIISRKNMWL
uniref:MOB kinase activator 3A n=1 Tax=Zonotrichia albicollis TaxID=44394 RepID=A0A8D2NIG4_ZONAL